MGIAFLLLGLLPLAFLPDFLSAESSDEIDDDDIMDTEDGSTDLLESESSDNPADTALLPVDEIDVSETDGTNPAPEDILAPSLEDDPASPSEDPSEDILAPVDEIESLAETISINFDEVTGTGYAEIEDFDVSIDTLHIVIEPGSVSGELDVSVNPSTNGEDSDVYVEGVLVAVLKGASDATAADVFIEISASAS